MSPPTAPDFRERLEGLFELIRGFRQQLLGREEAEVFRKLALDCRTFFGAEDVSVFRVPDDAPTQLELVAEAPVQPATAGTRITIPDSAEAAGCGLTGWCVARGEVVRYQGDELRGHTAVSRAEHSFVRSGRCFSLLAVPLLLKAGRPLGLLKINNRLGPAGPSDETGFSAEDGRLARILATQVAAHLDTRRWMSVLQRLTRAGAASRGPGTYYEEVLRAGLQLLRADRAMLALADAKHVPVMEVMANREGGPDVSGRALSPPSIMWRCWQTREPQLVPDVRADPDYFEFDPRTRSEAAVLLSWEGVRLGVLNVESDRLSHFDEHDLDSLAWLAPFVAAAHRVVTKEDHFRHILQELGVPGAAPHAVLKLLLKTALDAFTFANGHIFAPTADGEWLTIQARVGPPVDESRIPRYRVRGPGRSIQKKVFTEKKAYFAPAAEEDKNFNPEGREALAVRGPYLAIPLLADGRAVGVLSVWGGASTAGSPVPTRDDELHLLRYARVAASVMDYAAKRRAWRDTISLAIPTLHQPSTPTTLWARLLSIVQQCGFAHVRLFRFHPESDLFELLASTPAGPALAPGLMVTARDSSNKYAADTVRRARSSARPFEYKGDEFGPDPDAGRLGKDLNSPWVVIPLISHDRLYGQITADNGPGATSTDEEVLANLTLIGAVVALAVAQTETVARLQWQSLDKLHASIRYDDSERALARKLLVYLTHGQALGFSRAGFYRPEIDRLMFFTGLGSVVEGRFRMVATVTDGLMLERTLTDAERHADEAIEAQFGRVTIRFTEPGLRDLLKPDSPARWYSAADRDQWPGWVRGIAEGINSEALAVAPVCGAEGKVYGLFVVDRQWQDRPLSETDVSTLTTFGRHAALLFDRQGAAEQALAAKRGEAWKDVSFITAHDMLNSLSTISTALNTLELLFPDPGAAVLDRFAAMKAALADAARLAEQFRILRDVYHRLPHNRPAPVRVCLLIENAVQPCKQEHIVPDVRCPPDLTYFGYSDGLGTCLNQLVANARYWSRQAGKPNHVPRITVTASITSLPQPNRFPERRWLVLLVADNGPGVPPGDLDNLGKPGHTRRGHGTGYGLFKTYEIAQASGGAVKYSETEGGGATFVLTIPEEASDPDPSTQEVQR